VNRLLKHGWWALLLVGIAAGFYRLRFDGDVLNLLPPNEPTVRGLKLYQQHFTNARELIITVRAPDAEQAERLARNLAARLEHQTNLIATASWQPPWQEHPEQLAELIGCLWLNQPPESFAALTNQLAADQLKPVLAEAKEILATSMSPMDIARRAYDPYNLLNLPALTNLSGFSMEQGQHMFASEAGTFRLIFVESAVDLAGYRACEQWLNSVYAVVGLWRGELTASEGNGVAIGYTGRPVFLREIAGNMQHDMEWSVSGTALIIALLFWLTHRRWLPLLWLLTLLILILAATLALGGLLLGAISVVSMGFAAVLLGLAVDYAVVHYQEALAHPQLSVPEIRRAIAPSILWAAITTISAFLVLNLGGLPGLGQLGTLVAIGVALAAVVMVMIYLPPLFPARRQPPPGLPMPPWWNYFLPPQIAWTGNPPPAATHTSRSAWRLTALLVLAALAVLCWKRPGLDCSGAALRPPRGEAEVALDDIKSAMGLPSDPLWLVIPGRDEAEVYQRLSQAKIVLDDAVANHLIGRYLLPTVLWPRAEFQAANRGTAAALGRQGEQLRTAALGEGFNTNALVLTGELVATWARAGGSTNVVWPANPASQWLLKRFVAHPADEWLVMGMVYPATNRVEVAAQLGLSARLAEHQAWLSGWELLGSATLKRVQSQMWLMVVPMVGLVLASLWFAFRRTTEIALGMAALALGGLCLLATMALAGWSWNLLNLMAVPLMLGTGVDYTLFIQLALRRHGGQPDLVRRSVGRALLLCGGTAMAGFGALGLASNPGMASLGRVCAVGIGANMLISVFLLPAWWIKANSRGVGRSPDATGGPGASEADLPPSANPRPSAPHHSSFYRIGLWQLGLALVKVLPAWLVNRFCLLVAEVYWRRTRRRRELVVNNLLPACAGDLVRAELAARAIYRNFALKLADLWRAEGGATVHNWLTNPGELEIIQAARQRGRGVLFITLHLGNWEHGGLLLNQLGIPLTILTLAEPDDGLTALRIALRRRYGVGTLILGQDSFALVDVIKRLESGTAMALALDRPPARGGVEVEWFGQRFLAPAAAAELARASGCALMGVTIVRQAGGYAVKVLPEFKYDRQALGHREARRELTQKILRAFEPEIRKHLDQWYQFAPIWPQ
jgi:predicted exporter/lauroyl/myristoyl acyltransferase